MPLIRSNLKQRASDFKIWLSVIFVFISIPAANLHSGSLHRIADDPSIVPVTTSTESYSSTPMPEMSRGPVYHLEMYFWSTHVKVFLNGFPIHEKKASSSGFYNGGINPYLVGEHNVLRVRLEPLLIEDSEDSNGVDSTRLSTLQDTKVYGSIKRYGPDDRVSGRGYGEHIKEFDLSQILQERKQELQKRFNEQFQEASPEQQEKMDEQEQTLISPSLPLEFEITFSSEDAPSFRYRLREAPPIENEEEVLDYAMHLRKLMTEQDSEALWQAFKPKNDDFNTAFYENDGREWWVDLFQENYYPSELITEFGREHLETRRFCGGRVWEVYVEPDESIATYYADLISKEQPLFSTKGRDGSRYTLPVFVGKVDSELKIVR